MAEPAKSSNDEEILYQVVGLIVIVFIISSILSNYGFNFLSSGNNATTTSVRGENEGLSSFFPTGSIRLGDDVINKKEVDVFRLPARNIIGSQDKREVGKPIEGPVEIGNRTWWRIDYKNAPDGWVMESSLTDYVWTYRAFNIFPILFTTLTPFLILFSIILFALIIFVMIKSNKLYELRQKKFQMQQHKNVKEKIAEEEKQEEISREWGSAEGDKEKEKEEEENSLFNILPTDNFVPKTQDVHNRRWAKVETLINSHSVNDWKQAIIEADIILDEMMEKMGYKGQSVGEKLKQVEESDFLTLNQAWEAHKIRNRIAHKGSDYTLSRNDAERAFNLYKEVFEEFYFI